jgi:serine/threonine protein phosphatase PrpC
VLPWLPAAGDVICLATDGVLDNLFDSQLAELLSGGGDATALANGVASRARKVSLSRTAETPFSVSAAAAGFRVRGGKVDDIAVVVIRVLAAVDQPADEFSTPVVILPAPPPRSKM